MTKGAMFGGALGCAIASILSPEPESIAWLIVGLVLAVGWVCSVDAD